MRVTLFVAYFAVSIVLLMVTFRIDEYLRNSTLNRTSTIVSYVALALLLSIIGTYLAPWVTRLLFPKLSQTSWSHGITIAAIIFAFFCVVSALFGPLGVDLPGTRIRGIFFAEWKFVNFILYNCVVLALLGGVLRRFAKN